MSEVGSLSLFSKKLFKDDFPPAIVTAVVEDAPDLGFRNRRFSERFLLFSKSDQFTRGRHDFSQSAALSRVACRESSSF